MTEIKSNLDRKGTIVIRPGNENQEPQVVLVGGINGFDMLICHVLNSNSLVFSMPEENDLLDFDMTLFKKLKKEWKIQNLENQLVELRK